MANDRLQSGPDDELGWALDLLLDVSRGDTTRGNPCPKAIARAHARLAHERAELDAALRGIAQSRLIAGLPLPADLQHALKSLCATAGIRLDSWGEAAAALRAIEARYEQERGSVAALRAACVARIAHGSTDMCRLCASLWQANTEPVHAADCALAPGGG